MKTTIKFHAEWIEKCGWRKGQWNRWRGLYSLNEAKSWFKSVEHNYTDTQTRIVKITTIEEILE